MWVAELGGHCPDSEEEIHSDEVGADSVTLGLTHF